MARKTGPRGAGDIKLGKYYLYLSRGLFRTEAARAVGLNPATVSDWLRKGEDGKEEYKEFSRRTREAEAKWIQEQLDVITGSNQWQARAWALERRHASTWGPNAKPSDEGSSWKVDDLRMKLREQLKALYERTDPTAGDSNAA